MKIAVVIVASVVLFGCGSDATMTADMSADVSSTDSVAVATDSSAPVSQITIIDMKFSVPDNAMSTDRFELVNNDAVAHNLMLLDDTVSVDVAAGETVALPKFEPGNYPFHCHIHPDMMGELVVS
jgi:plastocyanin